MNNHKHLFYFDFLRIFACICVVFMHTASSSLVRVGGIGWEILNCVTSLAFCAVPLFFMMSGYLLLSSNKTCDIKNLFLHRLPRLLVPLAVWSTIASAWLSFENGKFCFLTFLKKTLSSVGTPVMPHFWFMYTLIAMYLISPFLARAIQSLDRKGHILLLSLCILSIASTGICNVIPYELYSKIVPLSLRSLKFFEGHLATFILGYYIGSLKKKIPSYIPVIACMGMTVFVAYLTSVLSNRNFAYIQNFQNQNGIFEVVIALCIFVLAKQTLDRQPGIFKKALSTLSALSFPIYLMHNVVLSFFEKTAVFRGGTLMTFLFTAIIFAVCALFLTAVSSIKGVCYLFCGVTIDSACDSCNLQYVFGKKITK